MKNRTYSAQPDVVKQHAKLIGQKHRVLPEITPMNKHEKSKQESNTDLAEILVITSYPPRECGIATYSQDLIKALNNKFSNALSMKVCALESGETSFTYTDEVKYVLKTSIAGEYEKMAVRINNDTFVKTVVIQHEFGFYHKQEQAFLEFVYNLTKPVVIVFHTVLPHPDDKLKLKVKNMVILVIYR